MPELKPGISYRYLPDGSRPKPFGSANTFSSSCPFSYGSAVLHAVTDPGHK